MSDKVYVSWHKRRAGEWYAEVNGVTVAEAAYTSQTGTEDYPWDWYLTDTGKHMAVRRLGLHIQAVGVEDTLRHVKDRVWSLLEGPA